MNIPSFHELENITDSRYSLAMLVAKRAREIVAGSPPLINTNLEKPVSIAIEEALEGAIRYGTAEEEAAQEELKELATEENIDQDDHDEE